MMATDVENGAAISTKKPVEEVAFLNAKTDEVKIRDKAPKQTSTFIGLSKEELAEFAEDPFWIRTRRVLFTSFWVLWLATLVAAATIIAVSPRCPPRPPQKWWDSGVIYRVFVKSYKDSNDDGKGDLIGLKSNLKYIKSLNVAAVSLSSFLPTAPLNDSTTADPIALSAVDVVDFMKPDPSVGTFDDVTSLLKEARRNGLKVILEIDLNLSSDEHPFFKSSVALEGSKKDFYVWRNSSTAPTLWSGTKGAKVWHFDKDRKNWFYSRSGAKYPEFNYGSEEVKTMMRGVLSHWLDRGVDGFLIQSAAYLYEDPEDTAGFSMTQPSRDFIAKLRKLTEDFFLKTGKHVVLIVDGQDESGKQEIQNLLYHDGRNPGANIVLNNAFLDGLACGKEKVNGKCETNLVKEYKETMKAANKKTSSETPRLWPDWLVSHPQMGRLGSRFPTSSMKDAFNLMMLTMEGSAFVWYGDEIGMTGKPFSPMQWHDGALAGFSESADPWLPIADDADTVNVKFEKAIGNDQSVLKTFMNFTALRSEPAFMYGQMTVIEEGHDRLFSFVREAAGHSPYYVAINFGNDATTVPVGLPSDAPKHAKVVATTSNANPDTSVGKAFDLGEDILLKPGQGVVLKLS